MVGQLDIDRVKECVGHRRAALTKIRKIVAMYREGKASASCMAEVELAIAECDRGMNQHYEAVK